MVLHNVAMRSCMCLPGAECSLVSPLNGVDSLLESHPVLWGIR